MTTIERLRALLDANANPDPEHPDPDSIWISLADSAILALPALLDVVEVARAQRRAEQMLSDASLSNPDRYLQAAEMLVEAKRAVRAALDRLAGAS